MYAKIQITGTLEVVTGLHIGGNAALAAIGAVDSPVVRDPFTKLPMIPGSSLKGKLRSLLAKAHNTGNADAAEIQRLFGTANKKGEKMCPSRILVSDMVLKNEEEIKGKGAKSTEIKSENSIDRLTAVANPRQIERVVPGAKFGLDIIYNVLNISGVEEMDEDEEPVKDLTWLAEGLKLLQYDYLGGSGSRGYGKVKFSDLKIKYIVGEPDDVVLGEIGDGFKDNGFSIETEETKNTANGEKQTEDAAN